MQGTLKVVAVLICRPENIFSTRMAHSQIEALALFSPEIQVILFCSGTSLFLSSQILYLLIFWLIQDYLQSFLL